jgi:hypothetical protein
VAAALAAAVLATGCRHSGQVTVVVTGTPRADWTGAVRPCLKPAWDWHVITNSGPAAGTVTIQIPAKQYAAADGPPLLDCLRRVDGVTDATIPGKQ